MTDIEKKANEIADRVILLEDYADTWITAKRAARIALGSCESELSRLRSENEGMAKLLHRLYDELAEVGGGADDEADPNNTSPEMADAHIAGLIRQEIRKLLPPLPEEVR